MEKKLIVVGFAVFAFGFGFVLRSNGGSEVVEPYRAPAPTYNYAPPPPPRPIFYAPPPVVGVFVGPGYGYYGRGYGYYRGHRFYGRHGYWRGHHHHWR